MSGSGLQELLEVAYATNTVSHMMSGKAVSRAVRGHMLVDAALNTILVADAYNVHVPTNECGQDAAGMNENEVFHEATHQKPMEQDTEWVTLG